jgi:predicted transcriptional regulator
MKQQEESVSKKTLTQDQIEELMSYPNYWRNTLREAAEKGELIKEVYEELKDLEHLT